VDHEQGVSERIQVREVVAHDDERTFGGHAIQAFEPPVEPQLERWTQPELSDAVPGLQGGLLLRARDATASAASTDTGDLGR